MAWVTRRCDGCKQLKASCMRIIDGKAMILCQGCWAREFKVDRKPKVVEK